MELGIVNCNHGINCKHGIINQWELELDRIWSHLLKKSLMENFIFVH